MNGLARFSHAYAVARRFKGELRPHFGRLLLVASASLGLLVFELAKPWPIRWIFDAALIPSVPTSRTPTQVIWIGALIALMIAIALALTQYWRAVRIAEVGHALTRQMRARIFEHLASLSPSYHSQNKSGDLLVRLLGDVPLVRTMLVDSSVELATRSLLVIGTVIMLFVLDAWLALAVLLAGPLLVLTTRMIVGRLTIAVRKQRRKEGEMANFVHEAIAGSEVIQSLGGAGHVVRRFKRSNRTSARAGLKATRLAAALSATVEAQLGVALACGLGLGGWRVLTRPDVLSPGELLVFLSYVRGLLKPVRSASRHAERIARGTAGAERVLEVLDSQPSVRECETPLPVPRRPESLEFEAVTYRYSDADPALRGVNFTAQRGKLVALVGPNGAGKSTLAMLAARLEDPDAGRVLLDDVPLPKYRLIDLRRSIGIALQHPTLFGETIRENLLIASPEASDAELHGAIQAAGASAIVAALPDGLDSELGAAGRGLSGGETRRLCLARTLLADPGIVIVDEPFAGLDRASAAFTLECLLQLASDRIVVVIAHALHDMQCFDSIALLNSGRITDCGTHDELSLRSAEYRRVVQVSSRPASTGKSPQQSSKSSDPLKGGAA